MAQFRSFIVDLKEAEGGFVNNKKDPGGATNQGVTLSTFRAYYGKNKTVEDLKRMTPQQRDYIYKIGFWDMVKGDKIKTQAIADTIADFAVNGAPVKSTKMVQYILNKMTTEKLVVNGLFNQRTLDVLNACDQGKFFTNFQILRKSYYLFRTNQLSKMHPEYTFLATLTKPLSSQKTFFDGWIKRVDKFTQKAVNLFQEEKKFFPYRWVYNTGSAWRLCL